MKSIAKSLIPLLDLTSLNSTDTESTIDALCKKAITPFGDVAAVCIYPQFISLAKSLLSDTGINIATVANFPQGNQSKSDYQHTIEKAILEGADEIDVVIPYQDYLSGNKDCVYQFVKNCRAICTENICLKVILETGALKDSMLIAHASESAILAGCGCDFLKTSTGKIDIGATLPAAKSMLLAINATGELVGFKASGGIRTVEQASTYLELAKDIMGENWISAKTMRFGASSLLDDILKLGIEN